MYAIPENSRLPYLSKTRVSKASSIRSRTFSGSDCADDMIAFGEKPGTPPSRTYVARELSDSA